MMRFFSMLGALWALSLNTPASDAEQIDELLRGISASMKSVIAFRETRRSSLYADPAVYTGVLEYHASSGALVKKLTEPLPATLTVDNRFITVETEGRRRRLSLRGRPALLAMANGYRALATARRDELEESFHMELRRRPEKRWHILLHPRTARLARDVTRVMIRGREHQVDGITTELANGDRQDLVLLHEN